MSIQLTIDEMLEILEFQKSEDFERLRDQVETIGTTLAHHVEVAVPELKRRGSASFEGLAFGGTCAPFEPLEKGPVPEVLQFFEIEVQEWKDMCDEMD